MPRPQVCGGLGVLAVGILDMLRFVEQRGGELDVAILVDVATQQRIAGDDEVARGDACKVALSALQHMHAQLRRPLGGFLLPVKNERRRTHDDARFLARHSAEKGERLQRFAEAHLVGEDSAETVLREEVQPVHTVFLVRAHHSLQRSERDGAE